MKNQLKIRLCMLVLAAGFAACKGNGEKSGGADSASKDTAVTTANDTATIDSGTKASQMEGKNKMQASDTAAKKAAPDSTKK